MSQHVAELVLSRLVAITAAETAQRGPGALIHKRGLGGAHLNQTHADSGRKLRLVKLHEKKHTTLSANVECLLLIVECVVKKRECED